MVTNENENTMVQHLWDAAKAVLRGKFIAIQVYLKKQEKSQITTLHLKVPAGGWGTKTSGRKEIIKNSQTKVQNQTASQVNSTKHLQKSSYLFSNYSKNRRVRKTSKLFYKASNTLIPKPDKDTMGQGRGGGRGLQANTLMNRDAKIFSKILASQIQQ